MAGEFTNADPNKNSFYDRGIAKDYAARYVDGYNRLEYPKFDYDCTNFASQVLHKGGMPQLRNSNWPMSRQWYCQKQYPGGGGTVYTRTWSVAHDFRYHWANVNDEGWERAYEYKIYRGAKTLRTNASWWNDLYYRCSAGDIIQYVYGPSSDEYGKTWHSQIVHRRSNPDTTKKISMAQHSKNGWRNLKEGSLPSVADDMIICLIRIKKAQYPIDTVYP